MAAFGVASWPGVNGFISCSYTASHGITPSVASLQIPDQDISLIQPYGTLVITDGSGTVSLPRAKIVDIKFEGGGTSPRTITLYIADRRWQWKFGFISGNWNQIDPYPDPNSFPPSDYIASGGPYMPGTFRVAADMMADCLAAMNEIAPLIDPAPIIPIAVQWDNENPAQALQGLCDILGYRIVYRPTLDQVVIVLEGIGIPLPDSLPIISGTDGVNPPSRPNAIQLFGGDTIWNDYLALEPIGFELDGTMKAIDDLSYRPAGGWGTEDPRVFAKVRIASGPMIWALAIKHVFRSFRVKMTDVTTGKVGSLTIPEYGTVTDRKQLVLGGVIYGLTKDTRGQPLTEPAYCVGSYFTGQDLGGPIGPGNLTLDPFRNTITGSGRLPIFPSVDSARGVVTFSAPVFAQQAYKPGDTVPASGIVIPPVLYIFTGFRIRNLIGMTMSKFSAAGVEPVPTDVLCPVEVIRNPELQLVVNVGRNSSKGFHIDFITDNLQDLLPAANYYLNAADQKYQLTITSERTYSGIQPIALDGAVQQVTWSVGGNSPATTRASRNSEHANFIPNYPERRKKEQVQNFYGKQTLAANSAPMGNSGVPSPGQLHDQLSTALSLIGVTF